VFGKAAWPAILDEMTWRRLRAQAEPERRRPSPRSALMGSGLTRCGRCGAKLRIMSRPGGRRAYHCKRDYEDPSLGGCGRLLVAAEPLEELIIEAVMQRLDTPELARALAAENGTADKTAADELADAEARLDELTDMFASGEIDRRALLRARAGLERRQRAAQTTLSRQRRSTVLDAYAGRTSALRHSWDHLGFDKRRAILEAIVDHITIAPATRRGPFFDPERVYVTWKV
jgi:hypothetical protein